MKRNTLIIAMLLLPLLSARAQYVTYNHDETKMNQVTVMETGAGKLTPALFYSVYLQLFFLASHSTFFDLFGRAQKSSRSSGKDNAYF